MIDFDPNKDYYNILGVKEDATDAEIKSAFRKAAMKHHPDKGGDAEKFKEINGAYQVIGDKKKRQQYDTYKKGGFSGFSGFGGGGFDGYRTGGFQSTTFDMEDIFDMFGDFFGGGGARSGSVRSKRAPTKGQDIVTNITISFDESYKGAKKEIKYARLVSCDECEGKGVDKNSQKTKCTVCNGKGVMTDVKRTPLGAMQVQTTCSKCHGEGYMDSKPCSKCNGASIVKVEEKVKVEIPIGIEDGQAIRMPGMGNYGRYGGDAGDLYIKISIKSTDKYKRQGNDVVVNAEISIFDAVLGAQIEVAHPNGKIKVKIPKGLQVGDILKVSGKGFSKGSGFLSGNGDLLVKPKISIPKKLSKQEEKLWQELKG